MSYEEMMSDRASWCCHALATVLSLPPVNGQGDEYDREVHEAFTMLSTCPEDVRRFWLADYGVPETAWQAWEAVNNIAMGVTHDAH